MRALIVASHPERVQALRAPIEAARSECAVLPAWAEASPRLLSARPDLLVVDFDLLVHDGLNSLLAADAQIKVLRLPAILVYDSAQARDVEAILPLVHFARCLELPPASPSELTRALNAVAPGIAAVVPPPDVMRPLESYADRLPASDDTLLLTDANSGDSALPPGTRIDGRYEIERLVETGGMGQIYRARQLPLRRPVALKVIRSDLARETDAVARFQLEAQTVSRLTHPNTIVLFDYGVDTGPHPGRHPNDELMFLAMEWLEGQTLEQLLDKTGPLPPQRAIRIAAQVAHSLAEAHDKAIVHRDLKPSNIFVLAGDFVKVLDFGIAKLLDTPQSNAITRVGAICGTPEYMSPEQARGEELDGRSDLYALGCVLYTMLRGTPPFVHEQALQIIIAHQTLPPPALDVPALLPRVLIDTIDTLLAKSRDERLPSAAQLAEILDQLDRGRDERARKILEAATRRDVPDDGNTTQLAPFHTVPGRTTAVTAAAALALLEEATSDLEHGNVVEDELNAPPGEPPAAAADDVAADDDTDDEDEFELLDPFSGEPVSSLAHTPEVLLVEPALGSGQLTDLTLARWLLLAARRRLSGTLTVTRKRLNQSVQLDEGRLVRAAGTRLDSLLGAFAWRDGHYRFVDTASPLPRSAEMLDILPFVFDGLRLHTSVNLVAAELARDHGLYPALTTLYADQAEQLAAFDDVEPLAALCDGQRTLGEVTTGSGLPLEALCRALLLLRATDALQLFTEPTPGPVRVVYRRPDQGAAQANAAAHDDADAHLSAADQLLLTRLERFLELFASGRLHEVFDVAPGCGPDAVHDAYTRFARDYSESRLRRKPGTISALAAPLHEQARAALHELLAREEAAPLRPEDEALLAGFDAARRRFENPDPWAAFGLARGCGTAAVDDVYFRLVNQHHPDHFAGHGRAEVKRAANDVFIALQSAYRHLLAAEGGFGARPNSGLSRAPAEPIAVRASGPVDTVARSGPNATVARSGPNATVARSGVSATVARSGPSATVARSGVSATVARPATSSGVAATVSDSGPNVSVARPVTTPPAPAGTRESGPPTPIATPTTPLSSAAVRASGPSPSVSRVGGSAALTTSPRPLTSAPQTPATPAAPAPQAQASRYRIAPPRQAARTVTPQPAPASTSASPRSGDTPIVRPQAITPPRTAAPPTTATATRSAPTTPPAEPAAPRQRKMSEILAERAARQAAAAAATAPAAEPSAAPQAPTRAAAPATSLPPEESFRAGEKYLARQQFEQARAAFRAAVAAAPGNGCYAAHLAWTEHLCDSSSADETQNNLKNARKMDEGYLAATYFLGKLALLQSELAGARGYFEAVLQKNPRHVDAQRELRLVKMRLEEAAQQSGGLIGRLARKLRGDS